MWKKTVSPTYFEWCVCAHLFAPKGSLIQYLTANKCCMNLIRYRQVIYYFWEYNQHKSNTLNGESFPVSGKPAVILLIISVAWFFPDFGRFSQNIFFNDYGFSVTHSESLLFVVLGLRSKAQKLYLMMLTRKIRHVDSLRMIYLQSYFDVP